MSAHTPTPWHTEGDFLFGSDIQLATFNAGQPFTDGRADMKRTARADAAFIVTSVNAHERLEADNAALRGLLRELTDPSDVRCPVCKRYRWTDSAAHTDDCRLDAALEEKE